VCLAFATSCDRVQCESEDINRARWIELRGAQLLLPLDPQRGMVGQLETETGERYFPALPASIVGRRRCSPQLTEGVASRPQIFPWPPFFFFACPQSGSKGYDGGGLENGPTTRWAEDDPQLLGASPQRLPGRPSRHAGGNSP